MQTITLEKEHWEAFAEILEDIYAKDNPYKYVLANAIRDAVAASPNNTADVTLADNDYEDAAKIAEDIKDYYYAIYPGAVYVASALGIKDKKQKASFRKKYPNIVTISLTAQEVSILQIVCKDHMIEDDEESIAYDAASGIDYVLDRMDIGEDCAIDAHALYLEPLTKALQDRIDDDDTPRKKRIILDQVQKRLLAIFSKHSKTIPKAELRRRINMSDAEKIKLVKTEFDEFEAQTP